MFSDYQEYGLSTCYLGLYMFKKTGKISISSLIIDYSFQYLAMMCRKSFEAILQFWGGGLEIEIRRLTSKKQNVLICKETWGATPVSATTSPVQYSSDLL